MRGEADATRTDLWAFGCVLYELLTGRRAFSAATTVETVGAVLMSDPDWNALPQETPPPIRDLLRRCLDKNLERRIRDVQEVVAFLDRARHSASVGASPALRPDRTRSIRTLAVLPFANASGDAQMDYLGDGVTESIILSLSRLPQLQVTAQSSVFRYQGQTDRAIEIARTLGVEAVVTGRVLQRGSALQISVELADVEGWRIWGGQYRRTADDIFEAEEAIAREISENLRLKLSPEHSQILARRQTGNVEAYHLYLKGRFHWAKRTEDGLAKSIDYFRRALELDPGYALAHAGLAEGFVPLGYYCHLPPTEAFPRARAAAERAIAIDPDLAEARSVMAMIKGSYEGDPTGAEREARAAIAASPSYPRAQQALAECLSVQQRHAEAVAAIRRGLELDPLALYMNAAVVMTHYFNREFDAALAHGLTAVDLDSDFYPAHLFVGLSYQQTGRLPEAIATLERTATLAHRSTMTLAALGGALAAGQRGQAAGGVLQELDEAARRGRYVSGVWVAAIHAALGDHDRALASLERARQDRCCWLMRCLTLDSRFDTVRPDPRFTALLQPLPNGNARGNV